MNEIVFISQVFIIVTSSLGALILGKEALVAFVCIQGILANLFVSKQIALFGLNATASDAFAVGATLGLNLLQEYFGKRIARKTIWINFFLLVLYAIVTQIHLSYTPSIYDTAHQYFVPLLTFMPRLVIASFIAYIVSQTVDYKLYEMLRKIWHYRLLIIRNYTSIIISQLIDTLLFSFLGLYGIVDRIWEIIAVSYMIKLSIIFIAVPFVGFSRKLYTPYKEK